MDDSWKLAIYLPEGTYAYKFIVDGQWMTDPANPNLRPDGIGIGNSFILEIKALLSYMEI